jgi:hypothetical protein
MAFSAFCFISFIFFVLVDPAISSVGTTGPITKSQKWKTGPGPMLIKYENLADLIDCPPLNFRHADRPPRRLRRKVREVWTPLFRGRGRPMGDGESGRGGETRLEVNRVTQD